jgi:hypothetical protein
MRRFVPRLSHLSPGALGRVICLSGGPHGEKSLTGDDFTSERQSPLRMPVPDAQTGPGATLEHDSWQETLPYD